MSKGGRSRYARRGEPTPTRQASAMHRLGQSPTAAPPVASAPPNEQVNQPTPATPLESVVHLSPAMRWLSALTRAFPYALIEYVLFLAVVENIPAATQAISISLLLVFLVAFTLLRLPHPPRWLGNRTTWKAMLGEWLGDVTSFIVSLGVLSVGLMAWAAWHQTGNALFSPIALILLLAAMALVVVAHYRHETSRAA